MACNEYTAVASNDSARELMQKDKLRELAVVLFERQGKPIMALVG